MPLIDLPANAKIVQQGTGSPDDYAPSNTPTGLIDLPSHATPVNYTWADNSISAAPVPEMGDVVRGFKTVWPQTKAMFGGLTALAGRTVGADSIKDYGLDVYNRNMADAGQLSKPTDDIVNAWDDFKQNHNFGTLIDTAQYWAGYGGAQALQSIGSALVGGAIGSAIGPEGTVTGAVVGGFEPDVVKGLLAKAIEKEAAQMVESDAAKSLTMAAARQLATKAINKDIGTKVALFAHEATQELGSIYPDAEQQAGGQLDNAGVAKVWGMGLIAASVGAAADKLGLDQVFGPHVATQGVSGWLSNTAKQVAIGMGREGAEEGIQTGLERVGANQSLTDSAATHDYLTSMFAGAVGGAQGGVVAGGAHALFGAPQAVPTPAPTPEQKVGAIFDQPDIDSAIAAAHDAVNAFQSFTPNATHPAAVQATARAQQLADEEAASPNTLDAQAAKNWVLNTPIPQVVDGLLSSPQEQRDEILSALPSHVQTVVNQQIQQSLQQASPDQLLSWHQAGADEATAEITRRNSTQNQTIATPSSSTATTSVPAATSDGAEAAQNEIAQSGGQFSTARQADEPVAQAIQPSPDSPSVRIIRQALTNATAVQTLSPKDLPGMADNTALSSQEAAAAHVLAKLTGKQVQFYQARDAQGNVLRDGGFVNAKAAPNTVFVNVHAHEPLAIVTGHEVSHLIEQDHPEAYQAVVHATRQAFTPDGAAEFRRSYGAAISPQEIEQFHTLDREQGKPERSYALFDQTDPEAAWLREAVGDLWGNQYQNPEFWTQVFSQIEKEHPDSYRSIIQRVSDAIVKMLNKILLALSGKEGFQEFVADTKAIKQAIIEATATAVTAARTETGALQVEQRSPASAAVPRAYEQPVTPITAKSEAAAQPTDTGEQIRRLEAHLAEAKREQLQGEFDKARQQAVPQPPSKLQEELDRARAPKDYLATKAAQESTRTKAPNPAMAQAFNQAQKPKEPAIVNPAETEPPQPIEKTAPVVAAELPAAADQNTVEGVYQHNRHDSIQAAVTKTPTGYKVEWSPDDAQEFKGLNAAQKTLSALDRENYTRASDLPEKEKPVVPAAETKPIIKPGESLFHSPDRNDDGWHALAGAYGLIAKDDDLYRTPISLSDNLKQIFAETDPGIQVAADQALANALRGATGKRVDAAWEVKFPRRAEGPGGRTFTVHDTAQVAQAGREVWINASSLKEGISGGNKLYAAVGNYAHNTGRVFIGDPLGLSDVAVIRRAENMLSLAVKFGTTEFLHPHQKQIAIASDSQSNLRGKVRNLDWTVGDNWHNLLELLKTTYHNTLAFAPEIHDVRFNPATGKFTDATGNPITADQWQSYADAFRQRLADATAGAGTDTGGTARALSIQLRSDRGSATLKRAAFAHTLVREQSGTARRGFLAFLGGKLSGDIDGKSGVEHTELSQALYSRDRYINSTEFKRWFGGSEVVNEHGDPLAVYHGTNKDFSAFDANKIGSNYGADTEGFFFTTNPESAHAAATNISNSGANIIPSYLSIKNPLAMKIKSNDPINYMDAKKDELLIAAHEGQRDGIIVTNTETGESVYLVFDPSQIKSAHNRGTFDPNDPNILHSTERYTDEQQQSIDRVFGKQKTTAQRFADFRKDWQKNLIQGVFSQFEPIKDLSNKAYMLARMSRGGDSTLESLMLYGKVVVDKDGYYQTEYTGKNGFEGFAAKVLVPLQGDGDRFLRWVSALRAERLQSVGLENLFTAADTKTLKTLNQGKMQDGASRETLYAKMLGELNSFNDSVLKIASESGLIDDATRQMFKDMPYVPFYRLADDETNGPHLSKGLVNKAAWKRLKGGTDKLNDDLLTNMLMNWSHLITASAQNRAAKATIEAAVKADVAEAVPSGTKGSVRYREDGQERAFMVNDPHLMDAITALEYAGLGAWSKPFVKFKRYLTLGVTVNPAFKIRNTIRDTLTSLGTADLNYKTPGDFGRAWAGTGHESVTRARMLASGGMLRFGSLLDGNTSAGARSMVARLGGEMILHDQNAIVQFWDDRIKPALEAYQEFGDRGENLNRAGLYQQLLDKGMSHGEASFWARDLMDFSNQGKWAAVRVLTQIVPFMNARLQGLYKLGRAGVENPQRLGTVIGATALASIALMLAYKDDDDWKKRKIFDRQNYFYFKVGDTAIRIPKPFEIGAIATIAEQGVELFAADDLTGKQFIDSMQQLVSNQLSMNPIPQLVKPMLDVYANKDSFSQAPIETLGMQRLLSKDRYSDRTSELARALGQLGLPDPLQLIGQGNYKPLSPVQIDSLVKGYFGWLGTMTNVAIDYGIRGLMDRGERPAMQLKDVFLAGNFVESLPSNSSRYVDLMYEQATQIEQAYASYREAVARGDTSEAADIKESHPEIRDYKRVEQMKRQESKISQQVRQIEASKSLSADTKRNLIDQLSRRRNALAENFSIQ